ncbi:MAG: hypothetical protein ACOCP8_04475 [archaeon]
MKYLDNINLNMIIKEFEGILNKYEPKNEEDKLKGKKYFKDYQNYLINHYPYIKKIFLYLKVIEASLSNENIRIMFVWKIVSTGIHYSVKVGLKQPEIFIWQDFKSKHIKYVFFDQSININKLNKILDLLSGRLKVVQVKKVKFMIIKKNFI